MASPESSAASLNLLAIFKEVAASRWALFGGLAIFVHSQNESRFFKRDEPDFDFMVSKSDRQKLESFFDEMGYYPVPRAESPGDFAQSDASDPYLWLEEIQIASAWRGHGLGTALLRDLIARAPILRLQVLRACPV